MFPSPRRTRSRVSTAPVRSLAWLTATLITVTATAQLADDDRGKLLAAARQGNSYLLETLLKTLPLGPSIDAILADHETQDAVTRAQQIANWQADRLPELWFAEPDRRMARAAVFGQMTDFLVGRLAQCRAGDLERAQILEAATQQPRQGHRLAEILAMEPREGFRRAAAEMYRALVRSELACGGSKFDPTGFVTAAKTASTDRRERAEAVSHLRNRFHPHVLPWLELERALDPESPSWPPNQDWPPTPRQLAQWWIQAGLRVPVGVPAQHSSALLLSPSPDDRRASACFAQAVRSTPDARLSLLGILVGCADKRIAFRALGALMSRHMFGSDFIVIEDSRIAPMATALLDHDEHYIASFAARQARCLVERGLDTPELRQAVVSRALAILSAPGNAVSMDPPNSPSAPSTQHLGEPVIPVADVVMAAAVTGDPRIVSLIATHPRDRGLGDGNRVHRMVWQKYLAAVAPWLDAEIARCILAELEPRLRNWAATKPPSHELQARLDVELAARLLPAIPEDLVRIYLEVFAGLEHMQALARHLFDLPADASTARLRQFVDHLQLRGDPLLYLLVPEVLYEAVREGGDRMALALEVMRAGRCWQSLIAQRPLIRKRLVDALAAAPVRREVAPHVLAHMAVTLQFTPAELLANLPEGCWHDEPWTSIVASCLQVAPIRTLARELEALRTFGRSPSIPIAEAAARRFAVVGESGREDLRATLDHLVQCAGRSTETTLALAVQAGLDTPALRASLSQQGRESLRVHVDADVPTLRDVLGNRAAELLPDILRRGTAVTRASALRIACDLDRWPLPLQEQVIAATVDNAPRIRFAAYTALKSRDPELHLCAWLVNEVVFDPDAAVRALAR